MEDVAILRIGDVRVAVAGDLLENLARDGGGVCRGGAELGQHDRSSRHESVEYSHRCRNDVVLWIARSGFLESEEASFLKRELERDGD